MRYETRIEGEHTVISLDGDIDLDMSVHARAQILEQVSAKNNVLVDLSRVEYIDSSGVASLVEGLRMAKNEGVGFALVGANGTVVQVLELARLDRVFPMHASIADALRDT